MHYKLSIGVLTMNRSNQLREALESCLMCQLPAETEFVVIDNASTDDTESTVRQALSNCGYDYYYEKLQENLGVGGGRNCVFMKARGEYLYVLDDDAVIDVEKNDDFFIRAIQLMERDPKIATLTTQIHDTVWRGNRVQRSGPEIGHGIYLCKMFCGGSHFLRKPFFKDVPYLPNKYGYEEIPPSLRVMDAGMRNVFCPELLVIHKPAVNKWNWEKEENQELLITGIATPYAIQKMMYPRICGLLLWLAVVIRGYRYLRHIPNVQKRVREKVQEICSRYTIRDKIKLRTVCMMVRMFGFSAF